MLFQKSLASCQGRNMRVGGLVGWRSIFRFSSPRRRCQAYPELPIRDQLAAAPSLGTQSTCCRGRTAEWSAEEPRLLGLAWRKQ